jgi:hypothetical protein
MVAPIAAARMPPPSAHKTVTEEQKALVRRWIEQGAPWQPHWSFVVPRRPALPAVRQHAWVRNGIDRFTLAALERVGLAPAPEADRRTLARRAALDLTGLPPLPADVEAFVGDRSPNAYEKLVDRLLESPRYGEHRARYWLDAARYGDTHGIHVDNYREIWPYRDWVIEAFNRNLPFDRFTTEQLAGDLLPNRTLDNQVATGFHRCNITTNEGGSIPEEVDAMYAKDRVETTAAVWLGLTAGCASCHDHKFDPLSQREFYQFAAFFKNTLQKPLDGNIPDTPPVVVVPRSEDRERWNSLQAESNTLRTARGERKSAQEAELEAWERTASAATFERPPISSEPTVRVALDAQNDELPAPTLTKDASGLPFGLSWGPGPFGTKALQFEPKGSLSIARTGSLSADKPFTVACWLFVPRQEGSFAAVSQAVTVTGANARGWVLEVGARIPVLKLIGDGDQDAIQVRGSGSARLPAGEWSHLCVTYDGSRRADGLILFINGKAETSEQPGDVTLKGSIATTAPLRLGSDGTRDFAGGALQDLRIYDRELIPDEALVLARRVALRAAAGRADEPLREARRVWRLLTHDAEYRTASIRLAQVEREQRTIRRRGAITLVMQENPAAPAKAHVLFRGRYDQPRDEVAAATPAVLHLFPSDAPRNRLGLARWLMDAGNPLCSRVNVNRFWQEVFGQGLVRTTEDFGIMGESPSHPELLDWLSVEFRESGWDVKRLIRLLVTSATYRQAALTTPLKLSKDPNNRLYSRGPRFRMDAEMLRDFSLAGSGLLGDKIGGPSVRPYQPPGVWEAVAMAGSNTRFYKQDQGDNLYRRSMYTFWKRAAPPASMDIFNAPSRENCTVRRERTNTPLQALVTMNDPQWVEAARHLAQRTLKEAGSGFDSRLDFVTLRLLSRSFSAEERRICRANLEGHLSTYRRRQEDAGKLLSTGDSTRDTQLDPAELAAWTLLCSQVMNLDEALCK